MIFVTVGSSDFEFMRLFKILDDLCDKKIVDSKKILAQTGNCDYKIKNYKFVEYLNNDNFENYVSSSEIIICHAGVGTIKKALLLNKKVIVFPRLQKYNEHVDDHQLQIANVFEKRGYLLKATNQSELISCLKKINNFVPKKYIQSNSDICKFIINYIKNG